MNIYSPADHLSASYARGLLKRTPLRVNRIRTHANSRESNAGMQAHADYFDSIIKEATSSNDSDSDSDSDSDIKRNTEFEAMVREANGFDDPYSVKVAGTKGNARPVAPSDRVTRSTRRPPIPPAARRESFGGHASEDYLNRIARESETHEFEPSWMKYLKPSKPEAVKDKFTEQLDLMQADLAESDLGEGTSFSHTDTHTAMDHLVNVFEGRGKVEDDLDMVLDLDDEDEEINALMESFGEGDKTVEPMAVGDDAGDFKADVGTFHELGLLAYPGSDGKQFAGMEISSNGVENN
jgi:hypothetical protein